MNMYYSLYFLLTPKNKDNVTKKKVKKDLGLRSAEVRVQRDFPGGSVIKTLGFHCRSHEFNPWSGQFHLLRCGQKNKQTERADKMDLRDVNML